MKRISLLILIALALPVGEETRAFVPLRTNAGEDQAWDLSREQDNVIGGRITYYLDPAGTEDLSVSAALGAVRAGIESWADAPYTAIDFVEDRSRPAASRRSGDRINLIQWVSGELGPFTFGTTWPTFQGGYMTDSDILMNEDVRLSQTLSMIWSNQNPGGSRTADVQGVITHEWGHAIGLDHEAIEGATMYYAASAGSIYFRTLHADDQAAVASMYPAADAAKNLGEIRGKVDVAGRSNNRGVHLVAIDAASGEIRVGAMSEPDGAFAIRALAPGDYYLVAAPFTRLSTLNGYWGSSQTSFLPVAHSATGRNGDYLSLVRLRAGETVEGIGITVDKVDAPAEPNDGPRDAFPLRVGDSICARIEDGEEEDWYRFDGTKGQTIYARVHSTQIGGEVDPSLQLLDRNGDRALRTSTDIRSPLFYASRLEGEDVDARIEGYTLPATGTYYLRIREESLFGSGGTEHFYMLTLGHDPDAASPARSEFSISPEAIHADGKATAEIRAIPKNVFGDPLGAGVTLEFETSGGGTVGPATYLGEGVYRAILTAPLGGPGDSIDVTMSHEGSVVGVPDAVSLKYIGIADPAQSEFFAEPRRIAADGVSTSKVTLRPRDATGYPLGTGRIVAFDAAIAAPVEMASAEDRGDGTYTTLVTAPRTSGRTTLTAVVDGSSLGTVEVFFGFDLLDVVRAIRDECSELGADASVPEKAAKRLRKAAGILADVEAALEADGAASVDVLKSVAKAVKQVEKALKKVDGAADLLPALEELTAAARKVATDAISGADPDDGKQLKQLESAEAKLGAGDEAHGAGKYSKAVKRFRAAARKAVSL